MNALKPIRASGRVFDTTDIDVIRRVIRTATPPQRAQIARDVCRELDWYDHRGELKAMSCRVALLKLHREGLIELPAPSNGNGNGKALSKQKGVLPPATPFNGHVNDLHDLELVQVDTKAASALWNGLIDRYHYLGYQRLPGAQRRYLIQSREGLLGAIGWGAAAWKVAPRDKWLGWTVEQREAGLHRVVNNARFLIAPHIRCQNLASKVLSMCEKIVPVDFETRYGVRPVLLETFVEKGRPGTCYRAANWQYLGQTQGRGKCDRTHQAALPIKDLYVRSLVKDLRKSLGVA